MLRVWIFEGIYKWYGEARKERETDFVDMFEVES